MPCRIENPLLRFLFQTLNPEAQESLYSMHLYCAVMKTKISSLTPVQVDVIVRENHQNVCLKISKLETR
jgi:hypothetical protein